ncbi:glycosyltransferase [Azospirillum sp. TSO22-1]|uniref:O-linked N-acetylglucosamine transferase family protein n=1 Tax=Azospirillum sp. TSO22-1 TaxID=716789 RepID=UPI0013049903|nr:glycosyltransferase [Azospirillum sp. TSO22-1]
MQGGSRKQNNKLAAAPDRVLQSIRRCSLQELIKVMEGLDPAGRLERSIELYEAWLKHNAQSPLAFAAYFNLGCALSQAGRDEAALQAHLSALKRNPAFLQAHISAGVLQEKLGRPAEAILTWDKVVSASGKGDPELVVIALNNLGRLLERLGRYEEALARLTLSLKLRTQQPEVLYHWVRLRQRICAWPIYEDVEGISLDMMRKATSAISMLSISDDPQLQLEASRRSVASFVRCGQDRLAPDSGYRHERLRIGYLSSNFNLHAVSILTAELYELHDRRRFEIYGFNWSTDDGGPMYARVRRAMDHFVDIHELSDEAAARVIRAAEIDILVDLQGLTTNSRSNILEFKPAPVQISYLGLPGTTALPSLDYVLADRYVLPEEEARFFTEKPLYLPECFQVNDRQRQAGAALKRSDYGLPDDALVFCAFNNTNKLTPELFAVWMSILRQVPDSILWLLATNPTAQANLLRYAQSVGVLPQRILFARPAPTPEYLARFTLADLQLDTFPFNGGTSTSDALWMGLPVLTCSGRSFASRMAGSLLRAVGAPELVTDSFAAYEALALALAADRPRLQALRQRIQRNRLAHPPFDTPRQVQALESLFEQVAVRPAATEPGQTAVPVSVPYEIRPRLSVIIPTHHRPQLLVRAVGSVKMQSQGRVQVIVVADDWDAGTYGAVAGLLDGQDLFLQRCGAPGPAASRNLGLDLASAEHILFLDDDDSFPPGFVNTLLSSLDCESEAVFFCNPRFVEEERRPDGIVVLGEQDVDLANVSLAEIEVKNRIPNNCLVFPRKLLLGRRFDDSLVLFEDWEFLLNVLADAELRHLPIRGPNTHKTDRQLGGRRGASNDHMLLDCILSIYRKWPGRCPQTPAARRVFLQNANAVEEGADDMNATRL